MSINNFFNKQILFFSLLALTQLNAIPFEHIASYPPLAHWTSCSIGNNRPTMEDAHCPANNNSPLIQNNDALFYGVFDGHAGRNAADFCAENFAKTISNDRYFNSVPECALHNSFLTIHENYKINNPQARDGTTAVTALIKKNKLYIANVGDARALLCSYNPHTKTSFEKQLSFDHKPGNNNQSPNGIAELTRIEAIFNENPELATRFGTDEAVSHMRSVSYPYLSSFCPKTGEFSIKATDVQLYRVVRQLSVARAIGDFAFNPLITPEPYINIYDLTGNEQILILACDGFWDVIGNQEAKNIALYYAAHLKATKPELFNSGQHYQEIARTISHGLLNMADKTLRSNDNITVTVIIFPELLTIESLKIIPIKIEGIDSFQKLSTTLNVLSGNINNLTSLLEQDSKSSSDDESSDDDYCLPKKNKIQGRQQRDSSVF